MIFRFAILACLVLMGSGCNQQTKTTSANIDLPSQMDEIERFFGVGNWRFIGQGDTSYYFFSRKKPLLYDVYHYSIRSGDSVNTRLSQMKPENDSLSWVINDEKMYLTEADNGELTWVASQNGKPALHKFIKSDSSHILYKQAEKIVGSFNLTIPVSSFLTRAKYDYIHETHYTDSLEIKSLKRKQPSKPR